MRKITTIFGFRILILLVLAPAIFAIECWTCTSGWDPKCDPFEPRSIRKIDCDQTAPGRDKPTLCRKVKGFDHIEKIWYTIRGCADNGYRHDAEPGCKKAKNLLNMNEETTCFCDDDFCNSSSKFGLNVFIAVFSVGLAYLYKGFLL